MADKTVRWGCITVYEFPIAPGYSSVPKHGGAAIGLASHHTHAYTVPIEDATENPPIGRTKKRKASADTTGLRKRRKRVRWIKPHVRVDMLTKAGESDDSIYTMLLETSDIAMSRRLTLRCP